MISGVSSYTNPYWMTGQNNPMMQAQQDFRALGTALSSNNLSAAQQAFSALQQLLGTTGTGASAQTASPGTGTNPLGTDLSALGSALQSGNLSSAQSAFAKVLQDLQASGLGQHHHHHHHQSGGVQNAAATSSGPGTGTTSASGTDSDGDNDNSGGGGLSVSA